MNSWLDRSWRWLGVKSQIATMNLGFLNPRSQGKGKARNDSVRNSQFHQLLQTYTERERKRERNS